MRREQYYTKPNVAVYRMITTFCLFLLFISTSLFLYFFFYQTMTKSLNEFNKKNQEPTAVYESPSVTIPIIKEQSEVINKIPNIVSNSMREDNSPIKNDYSQDESVKAAERIFMAYELGDTILTSRLIVDFLSDYSYSPYRHKVRLIGAHIMNNRGDYERALDYIKKILGEKDLNNEDYSESILLLGSIARDRKQYDSYIQSFLEQAYFRAEEPTKSKLAFYLGYLLLNKGDFQSSFSYFNNVIGEDGLLGKADLYATQVMRPETINELENFIKSYPASDNYEYVTNLFIKENNLQAETLATRGYLDSATRFYKKIIKYFPNTTEGDQAHIDLADLYYQKQNYKDAMKELYMVLDNSNTFKDPDALFVLGKISFEMDNQEDALGYFRTLVEKYPHSSYIAKAQEWQQLIFESLRN